MIYLYRSIAAVLVLCFGIFAKDKGLLITLGTSVLVAACIFFPPERYTGVFAQRKKWVLALGLLAMFIVFVVEANTV